MADDAPERDKAAVSLQRQRLLIHIQGHLDDEFAASTLAEETGIPLVVVEAELEHHAAQGRLRRRVAEDGVPRYTPVGRKKLGELLVEAGLITEQQLQDALAEQAKTGDRLGKILVERGYLPKQVIGEMLERQRGVPYVSLTTYPLDPDLLQSIPETIVMEHKVIPLARFGNEVHLAMTDPNDIVAIDQVASITRARVKPFLMTESDFAWAISRYLDVTKRVAERVGEVDTTETMEAQLAAVAITESPYDPPVVRLVDSLIQGAIRDGATDIHIEPQTDEAAVRYRIDGLLYDKAKLPGGVAAAVASRIKVLSGLDIAERVRPQDGSIILTSHGREYDLRVATVGSIFGERVVIRLLDKSRLLRGLEHLGLLPDQEAIIGQLLAKPYGMILVTGPTGCGKTTTLYSCISRINERSRNIMTVEDPVEYHLEGITQIAARSKMGVTFATGLRAVMRQDPDVIMVGETRDAETAQITVQAALTGHLVLTTLHTNDAAGAVVRLIEMGVEPYLITSSMLAAIGQRLVRTLCECRAPYPASPELLEELGLAPGAQRRRDAPVFYAPVGCAECHYLGYRGRIGIFEVMLVNDAIRELVLQRRPATAIREAAKAAGMRTMRESGIEKARQGITTIEELRRVIFSEFD